MRLFCDQCGTEFGTTTLRADSKFCSICGKELSDFIKQQSQHLFKTSPKAGRSTDNAKIALTKKRKIDEEEENGSDIQRITRGGSRNKVGQANGMAVDTTDETSSEENPESEGTEAQVYIFWNK
jgi:hypothetical protein